MQRVKKKKIYGVVTITVSGMAVVYTRTVSVFIIKESAIRYPT